MFKKIVSLALVVVLCLCVFPAQASAADYPSVYFYSDENFENLVVFDSATVGDVYPIRMKWFAAFNNEGYDIAIYNSNGQIVATASKTWTNSTTIRQMTVNWDTSGYDPGDYEIVVTKKFYSLYRWNEAPTTSTLYLTLAAKPAPAADPTSSSNPASAADPTPVAEVGQTIKDSSAQYKVKSSNTVEYSGPTKKSAKKVTIPDTITYKGQILKVVSIAPKAFYKNKNLTTVKIGNNVTTIGKKAFANCTALKSVTFGSGVRTIGDQAFYGCIKLKKINLPTSVTKIGKQAFAGDKELKNIVIRTTKLKSSSIGKDAFKNIYSKAAVRVPGSKLSTYKQILLKRGVSSAATIKKS